MGYYAISFVGVLTWVTTFASSLPSLSDLHEDGTSPGNPKLRTGRQVFPGVIVGWIRSYGRLAGGDSCNFGTGQEVSLCDWSHSNLSSLQWELSSGINSNWIGGPPEDGTYFPNSQARDDELLRLGGYVIFETSQIPNISGRSSQSAVLEGPIHPPTTSLGACLSFNYSVEGLSPEKLRVLLHPVIEHQELRYTIDGHPVPREMDHGADVVLWETRDSTGGVWRNAEVLYTCRHPHQIYLEGIPRDPSQISRRYRGFIAVDNINLLPPVECHGHCNFDGGFCEWTNENTDDFDWKLARGSQNPSTGPLMDRSSYTHGGNSGGYAYIDSAFPAKTGDRARLTTSQFASTGPDQPICMRFWTHMYGNGIGTLRVLLHDTAANEDRVIWSLSGENGNAWYQGQVPISSLTSFKIVFEGEIGKNNLGDIAIDDISYAPGPCPSAPQAAAGKSGDCTFEQDECGWTNVGAGARTDEMDWERRLGQNARTPMADHTVGAPTGNFMTLSAATVQRAGDRAWMVSPILDGFKKPRCLSFWYYMHEPFIDTSGPSLGGLKVYTRSVITSNDLTSAAQNLTPIWRLYNQQAPVWKYAQAKILEKDQFQVIFEGVHGSSRANGFVGIDDIAYFDGDCTTMPSSAYVSLGECSFEKDMCQWQGNTTNPTFRWELATIVQRPANLPDRTFGAPVGYAYFDIDNVRFSPSSDGITQVRLTSPLLPRASREQLVCFSFWFAAFGAGESTRLRVLTHDSDGSYETSKTGSEGTQIWQLTAAELETFRPEWRPAQVSFDSGSVSRLTLEGQANNGGFAIDDVSIHLGECPIRPKEASK